MADVIGNPALRAEFDSRELLKGAKEAGVRLKTTFEESNRSIEAQQRQATKRIQGLISQINAEKPRKQMFELGQAVQQMGGLASLSERQVERLRIQVERLTAAGAKAPKSLAGLTAGPSAAGQIAGAAQAHVAGGLAGGAGGVGSVLSTIGPAGLAAAAGVGAVTTAAMAAAGAMGDLAQRGSQLSDLSAKTQINVESLQRMEYAGSLVGVSIDTIAAASLKVDRALVDSPEKFQRLGLSVQQLLEMNPEQRFEAISTALRALPDGPQRTAAAFDLLGKSAGDVLPYLTSNLAEAHGEATRLGVVLDENTVKAADALDDALTRLGKSTDAFKLQLAAVALGSSDGATGINDLAAGVGNLAAYIQQNRAGFELLLKLATKLTGLGGLGQVARLAGLVTEQGPAVKTPIWRPGDIAPPELRVPKGPSSVEAEKERDLDAERKKALETAQKLAKAESQLAVMRASDAADLEQKLMRGRQPAETSFAGNLVGGLSPDQLDAASTASSAAYQNAIKLAQAAQQSGLGLEQIKAKLEGMGLSSEEAANIVEHWLKKQEEVKKATKDWSSQLNDVANLMIGMGGITGKFGQALGGVMSAVSGIGSFLSKLKGGEGGGLGKSVSGFFEKLGGGVLGKIGGAVGKAIPFVGTALSVFSLGKSLFGGLKSLFGGKSKEQKAAEKQAAEDAKKQAAEAARQTKIKARQDLEAGLGQAKASAESLMETLAGGGLSKGLTEALQKIIGKVSDALMKTGLGILDGRLKDSKEFQAAQGMAGDVAGAIGGMRQAGMVDTGLLAAGGAAAGEIQKQAVAAALAAGMTPEEAAKAGSAAIAPLLREQLNASLQSGKELDENTKALLEEAKKNGIEILADPAIETLDVAKQQLDVLKSIAGKGGNAVAAAGGLGPVRMPNLGGGLGPLIQTHADELAFVMPAHLARRGGIISAAAGLMTSRRADDGEPREGRGVDLGAPGGGGGGGGDGAGGGGGGDGGAAAPTLEEVKAVVRAAMQTAAPVVNFSNVQNVEANPFQNAESRAEAMRMIMEEAANQLDGNAGRFAAAIDRRIRERL